MFNITDVPISELTVEAVDVQLAALKKHYEDQRDAWKSVKRVLLAEIAEEGTECQTPTVMPAEAAGESPATSAAERTE